MARDVGEHNGQGRQDLLGAVEAQRSEQSEDHGQRGDEVQHRDEIRDGDDQLRRVLTSYSNNKVIS